ncbi:protein of unknown function [Moritella yayanosii]|uniref:Reverse transcriptase domain-containing protein n=1 Tax=Moritella yayanosii TaxID=69539 RepID=A0A330LS34_9GAMM|nr:protein of unknown function [Moritella yayanosii]
MMKRKHRIVQYADDIIMFFTSSKGADNVSNGMDTASPFRAVDLAKNVFHIHAINENEKKFGKESTIAPLG